MILANFYPTVSTQYGIEYTGGIHEVDYTDAETALNAYYMGYVKWDDVPALQKMSKFIVDSGNYVEFVNITIAENVPWFFTGCFDAPAAGMPTGEATYIEDSTTGKYVLSSPTVSNIRNVSLFNLLDIRQVSTGNVIMLKIAGNRVLTSTTPPSYAIFRTNLEYNGTPAISVSDFARFMNGEINFKTAPIEVSAGITETFDISAADLETGACTKDITNVAGVMQIFLVEFTDPYQNIDVMNNDATGRYSLTRAALKLHADIDGENKPYLTNNRRWHAANAYIEITNGNALNSQFAGYNGTFLGGFVGRLPWTFLATYTPGRFFHLEGCNFIAYHASSSRVRIEPIIPIKDVAHFLALQATRMMSSPVYGFGSDVYVPVFNGDNSPKWEYVNGSLAEIQSVLQTWQYTNIIANTFNENDIPEYGPSEDDTDSGGDDIRSTDWTNLRIGAANNFITLYGMTADSIADFGRQMWAKLADPAFWQMVGTAFTNDFSINPADMMKYFISLRYFPFDLSDFTHSTASGIYVGRAATPIAPSTGVAYPIRITNNVVQVDGGRLTIKRYYNDFRDFEPCTTVQIHVPFCGSVDVPATEVMGHEMDLTYKIDLQTGAMLAVLGVVSDTYYVIATLAGTCGASIPITANNNIEFLQRIATVGGGLIGGGISGAVKGASVGGEIGAVVGAVAGTVGGGVGALAGLPPVTVHKQGNSSGFANLGGVPYAYATVQRGRFERPANYGHTTGFACDFTETLSNLSGFTVCDNVDTSGLTCSTNERDEIKRLLESGVYV